MILLVVAIRIQGSLARDRRRGYQGILMEFRADQVDGRQSGCLLLGEKTRDHFGSWIRSRLIRVQRLARMCRNIGVLLRVINYIEVEHCDSLRDNAEVKAIKAA